MRRLLQNGGIGILVIALFLIIQNKFAFGADTKADDLKLVPIYSNGHVIYRQIGQTQINTNSKAKIQDVADSITFTIQDSNHLQTLEGASFLSKINYSSTDYYYSYLDPYVTTTKTTAGLQVQVNNLDWTSADTIIAFITTSKYVFEVKLAPSQAGTTIALAPDNSFTTVDTNIGYAGSGLLIQEIQVNYIDENGKGIGSVYLTGQEMIKAGTYDFITMANDNTYAYYLSKPNFQLTKENHTLNFDKKDASLITLNMHDSSANRMRLKSFYTVRENVNEISDCSMSSGINMVYVSKLNYQELGAGYISSNNGWRYYYDTQKEVNIQDDTTQLNMGTNFKVRLQNSGTIYCKEQYFSDLFISDEYNNRLNWVQGPNYSTLSGLVELTDSKGIKTNPDIDSVFYPFFQLPNVAGTYTLTYSVTGGIFPITPATASIIISNSTVQVPGTPPNLHTMSVTSNSVALAWDNEYGATFYNVYRATGMNGTFHLIGYSNANTYVNSTVIPNTTYKYYVTAVNSAGEGQPSQQIIVNTPLIAGDVDGSGKVDNTDYNLIKQYVLVKQALSTASCTAADVDGDGKITSKDYALVKKYLLKEINVFPVKR